MITNKYNLNKDMQNKRAKRRQYKYINVGKYMSLWTIQI